MSYPSDKHNMNSRMVIDACVPWNRKADWPETARNTPPLEKKVREKFGQFLPNGW